MWKRKLGKKKLLFSKFMPSQIGQQIIKIHILPNIPTDNGIWLVNRI